MAMETCEHTTPAENMPRLELAAKERETLDVIKSDICQWLSTTLRLSISPATFMEMLDTGVLLCKLARLIQEAAKRDKNSKAVIPSDVVKCNEAAGHESFLARDNTSNFISWCRGLGVEEAVIFESEGLVLHKDEKRVILCLLDVARFAERVGIPPPQLVHMEREIEKLEKAKLKPPPSKLSRHGHERTLEDKPELPGWRSTTLNYLQHNYLTTCNITISLPVTQRLKGCTCPNKSFNATSCGDGKFIINGGKIRNEKVLYARLLSDRIMIRVGGGWVTLDHFLLEHDPCRIQKFTPDGAGHGQIIIGTK